MKRRLHSGTGLIGDVEYLGADQYRVQLLCGDRSTSVITGYALDIVLPEEVIYMSDTAPRSIVKLGGVH